MTAKRLPAKSRVREIRNVASSGEPWVLVSFDELALVRQLEAQFPTLEDAGCKVGTRATKGDNPSVVCIRDTGEKPFDMTPQS